MTRVAARRPRSLHRRARALRWLAAMLLATTAHGVAWAQVVDLPSSAGPFEQQGFKQYEEPELGYVYRYVDAAGQRWFDIYVYPVPATLQAHGHEERVRVLVRWARRDIESAVAAGHYLSQNDLGLEGYVADDTVLAKSRHRVVVASGELYSVIYLTEAAGSAVKVRVSVPGTAMNVVTEDFEEHVLALIEHVLAVLAER